MLVVDVETTGTDPAEHSIVSIGAVDLLQPERQFYRACRMWDGARVQEEALAVNGFTPEQICHPALPSLEEAVAQFIAFCRETKNRTLAGHNTSFDRDFLQSSAWRYNLNWHFGNRVLDLHSFGWMHMNQHDTPPPMRNGRSGLSCDAIFSYCGLPTEPMPHNALTGAQMEAEAFARLMWGRGLLDLFKVHALPEHVRATHVADPQATLFS